VRDKIDNNLKGLYFAFKPNLEALQKALQLDENLAEAHALAAMIAYYYEWGWNGWFCVAMNRFDKAYEERETLMPFTPIYVDKVNLTIRSDPRYKELLARMKLGSG